MREPARASKRTILNMNFISLTYSDKDREKETIISINVAENEKRKKNATKKEENENHGTKCRKISEKNKSKFNIQSNKINTVSLVFIDHEGIYLYANIQQLEYGTQFFFLLSFSSF